MHDPEEIITIIDSDSERRIYIAAMKCFSAHTKIDEEAVASLSSSTVQYI
jgi:hypothetical protein